VPRSAIVIPVLGYLGYPLAVAGGLLIFGTCSLLTLDMITANIGNVSSPIAASADFNVPPVTQIGSLGPAQAAEVTPTPVAQAVPESSFVAVAPPQQTASFEVAAAEPADIATLEPPGLGNGRIGDQAVNVRAAPSKNGARKGVLKAGSPVRIGENTGHVVQVQQPGREGWVYQTYLAGG